MKCLFVIEIIKQQVVILFDMQVKKCNEKYNPKYKKMNGMDLAQLSLDTVKMFKNDAESAGFELWVLQKTS